MSASTSEPSPQCARTSSIMALRTLAEATWWPSAKPPYSSRRPTRSGCWAAYASDTGAPMERPSRSTRPGSRWSTTVRSTSGRCRASGVPPGVGEPAARLVVGHHRPAGGDRSVEGTHGRVLPGDLQVTDPRRRDDQHGTSPDDGVRHPHARGRDNKADPAAPIQFAWLAPDRVDHRHPHESAGRHDDASIGLAGDHRSGSARRPRLRSTPGAPGRTRPASCQWKVARRRRCAGVETGWAAHTVKRKLSCRRRGPGETPRERPAPMAEVSVQGVKFSDQSWLRSMAVTGLAPLIWPGGEAR